MATKKETVKAEEPKTEVIDYANLCSEDGVTGGAWDIIEKVTVPRARNGEEQTLFVSINGRQFYVPTGKTSELPLPVAVAVRAKYAWMDKNEEDQERISREASQM